MPKQTNIQIPERKSKFYKEAAHKEELHWDFQIELPPALGTHGLPDEWPENPGLIQIESICGGIDDSQPVEQYDGSLGVSQAFVAEHQSKVGQLQWNDNLADKYDKPGTLNGRRWCSGILISRDMYLTAGHCFDQSGSVPKVNGTNNPIEPSEIATNMHVNFNYQVDPDGNLRAEQSFPIAELLEYRLGGIDFAIVRLEGNPGDIFGWAEVAADDAELGDMLCIIQHPAGLPKRIEAGPAFHFHDTRIGYDSIDTLGGSSGSGILNTATGRIVGVHTNGGCSTAAGSHNHGQRISSLLEVSPILKSLRLPHPIDFQVKSIRIAQGRGRRSISSSVTFPTRVRKAAVALNGFKLDFVDSDHHINLIEADTDLLSIRGNTVRFRVECNYADKNFDDPYQGYITAIIIAEIE